LEGSRLGVEFVPFNGGHGIPDGVLDRLGPFVMTATATAKTQPASA